MGSGRRVGDGGKKAVPGVREPGPAAESIERGGEGPQEVERRSEDGEGDGEMERTGGGGVGEEGRERKGGGGVEEEGGEGQTEGHEDEVAAGQEGAVLFDEGAANVAGVEAWVEEALAEADGGGQTANTDDLVEGWMAADVGPGGFFN